MTSKFKWALRAQFLSHTLQISEINLSFEAIKLTLLYLINIFFLFSDIKKLETSSLSIYKETSMVYLADVSQDLPTS